MTYLQAVIIFGLTLLSLRGLWWLLFEPCASRDASDPRPQLAARDGEEFVSAEEASLPEEVHLPDEIPIPGHDGVEEVDIDSLWNRRN
jgi:hypothetical protein